MHWCAAHTINWLSAAHIINWLRAWADILYILAAFVDKQMPSLFSQHALVLHICCAQSMKHTHTTLPCYIAPAYMQGHPMLNLQSTHTTLSSYVAHACWHALRYLRYVAPAR
jgi:hypothetical protein